MAPCDHQIREPPPDWYHITLLPMFPEIVGIPLDPAIDTRIGLIWKRGRYLNQGMQEFLEFCRNYYQ